MKFSTAFSTKCLAKYLTEAPLKFHARWWSVGSSLASAVIVAACAVNPVHEEASQDVASATAEAKPGASDVSLKADRTAMEEARKDIPEEVRKQNDEIAGLLSFVLRESEEEPSRLRDRFNTALRNKRERSDRELRKKREDFTAKQQKKREEFLKQQKRDREDFVTGRRKSTEARKRFFDDQDENRRDFFANERDQSKDFESSMQETRKSTEDYIREKQNAFNQDLRAYQQRYTERKQTLELKKRAEEKARALERAGKPVYSAPANENIVPNGAAPIGFAKEAPPRTLPAATPSPDPLAEFEKVPPGPGVPLIPGKKGP